MNRPCTILSIVLLAVLASPLLSHASGAVSEQIEWQAENDSDTRTIKYSELTVRLSRHPMSADGEGAVHTRIEIFASGARTGAFHARNAWGPGATVQFAEFDTKNRFPEVLLSTYSGGAHCCYSAIVLTFSGKKWVEVPEELGGDGGAPDVRDVDNDGRAELIAPDGAFLYAFSSYASSEPPARIYHLSGTKWIDVTRAPHFRSLHATEQERVAEQCNPEKSSNGFWAGYVASSILIGEGRSAWRRMLGCYDRSDDWALCKRYDSRSMECSESFPSFPHALDEFLRSSDYGAAVSKREIAGLTNSETLKGASPR